MKCGAAQINAVLEISRGAAVPGLESSLCRDRSGCDPAHGTRIQTAGVALECFMTGAFLLRAGIRAPIETYITATVPGWLLKMMLITLMSHKL